jgi:hypothetical protein
MHRKFTAIPVQKNHQNSILFHETTGIPLRMNTLGLCTCIHFRYSTVSRSCLVGFLSVKPIRHAV